MDSFLSRFLKQQKKALLDRLKAQYAICSLSTFEFSPKNDITPDYTKYLHRILYYLRYSSSYIIEYYNIYKHIFTNFTLANSNDIRVLSIGCGAMLDLVGFYYALQEHKGLNKRTPYYYGVDLVDWKCEETRLIDNAKLILSGIEDINFISDGIILLTLYFFQNQYRRYLKMT